MLEAFYDSLKTSSPAALVIISIALMLSCGFAMTRLTKQRHAIEATLESINPFNGKSKAQEISKHITFIFFFALVGCSFFLYLRTSRLLFLLIGGYFLLSTTACRKTPCKKGQYWVQ